MGLTIAEIDIRIPIRIDELISGSKIKYTPREPAISPFKPINRPLKTDCYNGTTYNRLLSFMRAFSAHETS